MHLAPDPFPEDAVLPRLTRVKTLFTNERRKWSRANVQWPIRFFAADGELLECTTRNVSSGGFYVLSERRFHPGECLDCILSISSHAAPGNGEDVLCIECRVEVVRVESSIIDSRFGTAYRILEYRVCGPHTGS